MNYLNIKVPKDVKIAVITDVHEHSQQFFSILEKIKPSEKMWLVSAGDFFDKGYGPQEAEKIIDAIKPMIAAGYAYAIRGNHEIRAIREARKSDTLTPHLEWCEKLPLALSFQFVNNTRLTIVHGGILPRHQKLEDLAADIEICYVRTAPSGEIWHKEYNGRFGYLISGHFAQDDGIPKFYNYSSNIDTAVYKTGILTSQFFSATGNEGIIQVKGTSRFNFK